MPITANDEYSPFSGERDGAYDEISNLVAFMANRNDELTRSTGFSACYIDNVVTNVIIITEIYRDKQFCSMIAKEKIISWGNAIDECFIDDGKWDYGSWDVESKKNWRDSCRGWIKELIKAND